MSSPPPTQQHRKPPMPPWFAAPRYRCCRWCNLPVVGRAKWWHPECSRLFHIAIWMDAPWHFARIEEHYANGNVVCALCGKSGWYESMELDHIVPLIADHSHIRCWMPANLQFLCHDCHVAKTARDMQMLRESRRAVSPRGLFA